MRGMVQIQLSSRQCHQLRASRVRTREAKTILRQAQLRLALFVDVFGSLCEATDFQRSKVYYTEAIMHSIIVQQLCKAEVWLILLLVLCSLF
jgi:hypothetical protein